MNQYAELITRQRNFFHTQQTKSLSFRLESLHKLREAIIRNEPEIVKALHLDLNKSEFEAYASEIGLVLHDISFISKRLHKWARPTPVKTPLTHVGSKGYIYNEPYGVALIIAPWNFPFLLALAPLIGAIAAGNCAVVKPSELTPHTSSVIARLISEIFDESYVTVVEGGVEVSEALLALKTDYIFFTGSVPVGKIVMQAAALNLTPVTLELGGKSPCFVHHDANLKLAAKRIAWGKFVNAGQTCIAPDYILVHRAVKDRFLAEFMQAIHELYGPEPLHNQTLTRIVSKRHFDRLVHFLNDGVKFIGGGFDETRLAIEPTVLTDISRDDTVMQEEIFGPILPILEYDDLQQELMQLNNYAKPLALYIFSQNKETQQLVIEQASFGGGCVNDTVYQFTTPYLPFGGVGDSGVGAYHGKGSYDTFTHSKSVLKQTTKFDIPFRYPHMKNALSFIKRVLK